MSARALRDFLPALREVDKGLSVPLPRRVRVLRELEADLEELRQRLEAEGLSEDEARTRSLAALVPDPTVLRDLVRVHTPRYRHLTRRLPQARLRILERLAFMLATLALLIGAALVFDRSGLLDSPSPFVWPVLVLGGLSLGLAVESAFRLWVLGDHPVGRGAPHVLLAMAGATLLIGISGALVDSYLLIGAVTLEARLIQPQVGSWLLRETALLSISFSFALSGALAWFVLAQRVALVESAYRDVLGGRLYRQRKEAQL